MAPGSGTLFRVKGSRNWHYQFFYGGERYCGSTGEVSKEEARDFLEQKKAEVRINGKPVRAELTVGDLLRSKLAHDRHNELRDISSSEGRLENHLLPFFEGVEVAGLTTSNLRVLIDEYISLRRKELVAAHEEKLAAGNKLRAKRGLRPKVEKPYSPNGSLNRELSFLRSAWLLEEDDRLPRFPKHVLLTEDNTREGFLTQQQYEKLSLECQKIGTWLAAALELGWAYGWRRGEIFKLKVGQVNFLDGERGSIRLYRTKGKRGKKGLQGRLVVMTKRVRELLASCCAGKSDDDFVLTRPGSKDRIVETRDEWERAWRAAEIAIPTSYGLAEPLLHDLRRSAVNGAIGRGVSASTIMKIGGWDTPATMERYHIVNKKELEDAAERLDAEQAKPRQGTVTETVTAKPVDVAPLKIEVVEVVEKQGEEKKDDWWAHQDLNLGPTDYESAALTN